MKKYTVFLGVLLPFLIELAALLFFAFYRTDDSIYSVAVNEVVHSVKLDWQNLDSHQNNSGLDYVVLGQNGELLYRTKEGLCETVSAAISHRDTILTLEEDGALIGTILIFNDTEAVFERQKRTLLIFLAVGVLLQCCLCAGYMIYFYHTRMKPFQKLKGFAERIADGNLDIPLEMDRQNVFGAFTESFDIMRTELKQARIAEAKANRAKKELTAKLSHDIKTPIASIKAASEVGCAIADNEKIKENYLRIIQKADQIDTLITNLFTAAIEELEHLTVSPSDMESRELANMLFNADYLGRAAIPVIPDCLLYADKLRLLQVFDNIFANSYKYANTDIFVSAKKEAGCLLICIEDRGNGVKEEELPLLTEKFKRGSNAGQIEGAGLGLYISERFLQEMGGGLFLENGTMGFRVTVQIAFSGTI